LNCTLLKLPEVDVASGCCGSATAGDPGLVPEEPALGELFEAALQYMLDEPVAEDGGCAIPEGSPEVERLGYAESE